MTNFLEHLARENDSLRAASRWVASLKEKGLIVKASALTQLIGFGSEISPNLGAIVAPDYTDAEDVLGDIYIGGLSVNCNALKQKPYPQGLHLDHNRSFAAMRDSGVILPGNSFAEAMQYIIQLRKYGVFLNQGTWKDILADEHRDVIDTPLKEIELCAASGRLVARCKPGWTNVHTNYSRYRLNGEWNENPILREVIETYYKQKKFEFTDGICDKCNKTLEEV